MAVVLVVSRGGDDAPASTSLDRFGEVAVTIEPATGPARSTCMLAARTAEERARGLMAVTDPDLAAHGRRHDGMVFVYGADADGAYWMRNTPMALSIAWLDAGGRIVSTADMSPCGDDPDCPLHPAAGPYRYAVEVPRGGLGDLGLTGSARARIGGTCP